MARWVETSWFRYTFEEEHNQSSSISNKYVDGAWSKSYYRIKQSSLENALNDLMRYCNEEQLEVKSIMPITRAETYEFGLINTGSEWKNNIGMQQDLASWGWGLGHGWGITMIEGFMALLQRIEDVSQEEFDRRIKAKHEQKVLEEKQTSINQDIKNHTAILDNLKLKRTNLEKEIEQNINISQIDIVFKKVFFGGVYLVDTNEFKEESEAQLFKKDCKDRADKLSAEVNQISSEIAEAIKVINVLNSELSRIDVS